MSNKTIIKQFHEHPDRVIKLKNVRLSYANLYFKVAYNDLAKTSVRDDVNGRYTTNVFFDFDDGNYQEIEKGLERAKVWAEKAGITRGNLKESSITDKVKTWLDKTNTAGQTVYPENTYIASFNSTKKPVLVVNGNQVCNFNEPEQDVEKWFESGRTCDVVVNTWIQDNGFGKRINFNLVAVFFKEATPLLTGDISNEALLKSQLGIELQEYNYNPNVTIASDLDDLI